MRLLVNITNFVNENKILCGTKYVLIDEENTRQAVSNKSLTQAVRNFKKNYKIKEEITLHLNKEVEEKI